MWLGALLIRHLCFHQEYLKVLLRVSLAKTKSCQHHLATSLSPRLTWRAEEANHWQVSHTLFRTFAFEIATSGSLCCSQLPISCFLHLAQWLSGDQPHLACLPLRRLPNLALLLLTHQLLLLLTILQRSVRCSITLLLRPLCDHHWSLAGQLRFHQPKYFESSLIWQPFLLACCCHGSIATRNVVKP